MARLVGNIQNVVAQKPTMPILSNVLVEAANDEVTITATDLTIGTRCHTPAKVLEEGATTLPAKKLYQLIKELSAVNIEVSASDTNISDIIADTSHFKLNGMGKTEYPLLPEMETGLSFVTEQGILKEMLYRTAFAVSREDSRYVLTGVLMSVKDGTISFVGTDGRRLAKSHTVVDIDKELSGRYVIPLKAVEEIFRVLEDTDEDVTVYAMEDKLSIQTDEITLVTKLLTGDFPDFERVLPAETNISVTLHRKELMQLLKQISLFVEGFHSVRFSFVDGELVLSANNMNIGEGKVSMPVNYSGEKLDIAFNPTSFLEVLSHSKDETVNLALVDSYNPGIITDSSNVVCIIMPMRLNEDL